ncbi:uncharacterized protein LOC127250068 [Andrographis paniculata]|uniref:uncharacterized protein LOC127250068 n=1 Tax=Andrographis paniculata TaxID=175694 RepID=UPI0021E848C1|nr:uncharacterized protein LOC127250068 [Andrographis paniculata]
MPTHQGTNSFAKPICSICYEDLRPAIEHLQSISLCGHVFHELCLQQWFEYCPNLKKKSCPICKQACTNANVGRLYFQSVGDPTDCTLPQKSNNYDRNPEELQKEVNRLEGKALALASSLEQQQKEFKQVNDQLLSCKEQLKIEMALKSEALTRIATTQQLLCVKSKEQDILTLEHKRLQERNMALAKELAALKLASDLDLEEDEIVKLASLGNEIGSRESIDVLRKSLVIRNKSYKELMAKCNTLGRGEAQCLRKLEKANEKIKKLKSRVQALEASVEIKENEALRVLKDQGIKSKMDLEENEAKRPVKRTKLADPSDMLDTMLRSRRTAEPCELLTGKSMIDSNATGHGDGHNSMERVLCAGTNQGKSAAALCPCTSVQGFSSNILRPHADYSQCTQDMSVGAQNDVKIGNSSYEDRILGSLLPTEEECRKEDQVKKLPANVDGEGVRCYGDTNSVQASFNIRKETAPDAHIVSPQPGGECFSGGVLGGDGTQWHLGKWSKKGQQSKGSSSASNYSRSGDLIAVGADGRGGQIKVMRSVDRSLQDQDVEGNNYSSRANRKRKPGPGGAKSKAKANKLQQQGHLQIEHFFHRTSG